MFSSLGGLPFSGYAFLLLIAFTFSTRYRWLWSRCFTQLHASNSRQGRVSFHFERPSSNFRQYRVDNTVANKAVPHAGMRRACQACHACLVWQLIVNCHRMVRHCSVNSLAQPTSGHCGIPASSWILTASSHGRKWQDNVLKDDQFGKWKLWVIKMLVIHRHYV